MREVKEMQEVYGAWEFCASPLAGTVKNTSSLQESTSGRVVK